MDSENNQKSDWLDHARHVLRIEADAITAQSDRLDSSFEHAVESILALKGRLVVVGMGKSGIIAKKIAATFASTGTPAMFVHAAEAQHGDLGMITRFDAVLVLSHSGETDEIRALLPVIKRLGVPLVAITGNTSSSLAAFADVVLHVPVTKEACPMNLAPTASTTAALALGDALAVVVLKQRDFREDDFARVHPAGSLGRKLMKITDLMHEAVELPMVLESATLREAISMMSRCRMGITGVGQDGKLIGCITDGDLRRMMEHDRIELNLPVNQVMHTEPYTIAFDHLASEAAHMMDKHQVTVLFVIDNAQKPVGIIHLHDLLKAGIA
ncbi:MAG: KpsF/GutQ family sugar-phosphate isomerase [Mariprofundaceae bacterium]